MSTIPPIKKLEEYLTKLVYHCVFARDDDKCQVCNKRVSGKNRHPSHIVPKARSLFLRWDMDNILTKCMYHHLHWWHQHPFKSGKWFRERFPRRAKYLDKNETVSLKDYRAKKGMTQREWLNEQIKKHEQIFSDFGRTFDR